MGARDRPLASPTHYLRFANFQPTFLYELIWNLLLATVLAWLVRRHRFRAPGVFALYVAGYSGFRILNGTCGSITRSMSSACA